MYTSEQTLSLTTALILKTKVAISLHMLRIAQRVGGIVLSLSGIPVKGVSESSIGYLNFNVTRRLR